MTRCREADRLMLAWYATATRLNVQTLERSHVQTILDDRGKPAYQRALAAYREHIQNCIECRKLREQWTWLKRNI